MEKINSFIKLNDGADFTPTTFIIYEISNYKTLITVFDKKLLFTLSALLGIFIMHLVLYCYGLNITTPYSVVLYIVLTLTLK